MSEYQEAGVPPAKETTTRDVHASGKRQAAEPAVFTAMPDDPTVVRQFLAGEYCLKGGSGWWHFEVCNGQYVKQFHVDRDGHTNIYLGYWNEEVHKDWYTQKFSTKKKKSSNYVVHYYAGGDICDITQQPRNVQVKLRSNTLCSVVAYYVCACMANQLSIVGV
jgi:endoplasmic reticulum lectin 1